MTHPTPDPAALLRQLEAGAEAEEPEQLSPITLIHVDMVVLGVRYVHDFTFEVPKIGDFVRIGQLKAMYFPNGCAADPAAAELVEWMCYLEVTLKGDKPAWWKPTEWRTADLLQKVYAEAIAYANRFLGRNAKQGAARGNDAGEDAGGVAAPAQSPVVPKVQSPEQRSKTLLSHTT